jgi:hypothetical protein
VIVIAIGIYGLQGGWRGERSYAYTQGQSVGHGDGGARAKHVRQSTAESYAFTIQMGIAGIVTIVCGVLIQSLVS